MPARGSTTPVERLREAATRSVVATSLRQVAAEIGMSLTGLRKFLDGPRPYSATVRKLERWYVTHETRKVTAAAVISAIEVLIQHLPPAKRPAAVLRILGAATGGRGSRRPLWWKTVTEHFRVDESVPSGS